jgi:uncharacterized protein HemY
MTLIQLLPWWFGSGLLFAPLSWAITIGYFKGKYESYVADDTDWSFLYVSATAEAILTILAFPVVLCIVFVLSERCRYGLRFA